MTVENRPLVTNEHVEFEKQLVQIQDFKKITDLFRGLCRYFLTFNKEKLKYVNM
jgi:hypothetical protein